MILPVIAFEISIAIGGQSLSLLAAPRWGRLCVGFVFFFFHDGQLSFSFLYGGGSGVAWIAYGILGTPTQRASEPFGTSPHF